MFGRSKYILILSVLALSGCTSSIERIDREYEQRRSERRLVNIEDAIDRLIKAQQITSDAVDFLFQQLHELRHENDHPMERVDKFDI